MNNWRTIQYDNFQRITNGEPVSSIEKRHELYALHRRTSKNQVSSHVFEVGFRTFQVRCLHACVLKWCVFAPRAPRARHLMKLIVLTQGLLAAEPTIYWAACCPAVLVRMRSGGLEYENDITLHFAGIKVDLLHLCHLESRYRHPRPGGHAAL